VSQSALLGVAGGPWGGRKGVGVLEGVGHVNACGDTGCRAHGPTRRPFDLPGKLRFKAQDACCAFAQECWEAEKDGLSRVLFGVLLPTSLRLPAQEALHIFMSGENLALLDGKQWVCNSA
jgi:hypothetical protein